MNITGTYDIHFSHIDSLVNVASRVSTNQRSYQTHSSKNFGFKLIFTFLLTYSWT